MAIPLVLATPRMSYDVSAFRATIMGRGWRELWQVPVRTQVLDLDEYAGGLTVVRRGGGKQTRTSIGPSRSSPNAHWRPSRSPIDWWFSTVWRGGRYRNLNSQRPF